MATFVLIHGAWSRSRQWADAAELLRHRGHRCFTPSLTGVGDRVHLATPEVDMETHIADVIDVFERERLSQAILVGYSYSGTVVSGVCDRIPERIAHLVYVDATVAEDGKAHIDLFDPRYTNPLLEALEQRPTPWQVPPAPPSQAGFAQSSGTDGALTIQPIRTFTQPVSLRNLAARNVPRSYIFCTADKDTSNLAVGGILRAAQRARTSPDWRYIELDLPHSVVSSHPEQIADVLDQISKVP